MYQEATLSELNTQNRRAMYRAGNDKMVSAKLIDCIRLASVETHADTTLEKKVTEVTHPTGKRSWSFERSN